MLIARTVEKNGKKEIKLFYTPRKDKIKIKSCPKNQIVEPWKKFLGNKFRAVNGKLFKTKKEMKSYNQMFVPKSLED